jgi:predicted Ser/Thr protein kinase
MNEHESNPGMDKTCPQCGGPLPSGVLTGLCPACLLKQGAAPDTAVPLEIPPFQPPSVEEVARLFPQLEIISFIGKGGMGAVYKARQPGLDRLVALKILPPQTATGPGFVERFNREARALAKLSHPNIVAVHEFGQVNGLPYFIMEFVDGLNLRMLELDDKLSPREALQIVPQICEALQFAHDEGIVHRDIKPENILVDKKGRVKIADFGIAKILGGTPDVDLTKTKGALGTPHYMAPEQMEKPAAVDHRADIFSLGVVFYEMLTGELPLGKFSPPSSRKVEVDVRLDDVVLRTLEKDPERRYQHASQVKTAVDNIAGSAPPPKPAAVDLNAFARNVLARDYVLDIRSCLRRAWKLVRSDFWPCVGVTALLFALLGFASSVGGNSIQRGPAGHNSAEITSAFAILVGGPLMGGLLLYFLKKIRNEKASVETIFCGFSHRFLQFFLAGFVTTLLIWLGFLCFALPGIYLLVAWLFTMPLVIDKQIDFWSAMELSRKVITKHWWSFFLFTLILGALGLAGLLALGVGIFVMTPVVLAALLYAYEDIFGGTSTTAPTHVAVGPSGTVVSPVPPQPASANQGSWTMPTKIGLAAAAVSAIVLALVIVSNAVREHRRIEAQSRELVSAQPDSGPSLPPTNPVIPMPLATFGPEIQQELTNLAAVNLASGQTRPLPDSVTDLIRGPEKDSATASWMESVDVDFAFLGSYDGFYSMTRDLVALKRDEFDTYAPHQLKEALHDKGQDFGARFGDSSPLNNPTNYTYGFKTRAGAFGVLQIVGFTDNPTTTTLRYKLVQESTNAEANPGPTVAGPPRNPSSDSLTARLEAASSVTDFGYKDRALASVVMAAAQAGNLTIVKAGLARMIQFPLRDHTAHEAAGILSRAGMRKEAVAIAKGITDFSERDKALAELAE